MRGKVLSILLALSLIATSVLSPSFMAEAAEAKSSYGTVSAAKEGDVVSIGNNAILRTFSVAGGKLTTTEIVNKRTDNGNTVFAPGEGSEEFIIKTTKEGAD